MKLILPALSFLISFHALSQDTTFYDNYSMEEESMESCDYYQVIEYNKSDSDKVVSRSYYRSGMKKSETHYNPYDKGIQQGTSKTWFENGQIQKEIEFNDGNYHGQLLTYWEDGTQKRADTYEAGELLNGTCWDADGNVVSHFDYEVMPEFPGGESELFKYLGKNIRYPKKSKRKGRQGTVYVKFVVDTDGSIVKARVIQGVSKKLDKKALKVVKKMPNWEPGLQDGEPVRVVFNLPIRFTLQNPQ